ncbi:LOW QUALITY PROTEIN: hypothetical protein MXB_2614, partial [Myxobolus squamalis]
DLQNEIKNSEEQNETCRRKLLDIKLKSDEILSQVKAYEDRVYHIEQQIKKLVIRTFNVDGNEILGQVSIPSLEEINAANRNQIHDEIKKIRAFIDSHHPDLIAIEEYCKKNKLYTERLRNLEDFTQERDIKSNELKDIKSKRLNDFMDGFSSINYKLKEMYQLITLGGDAELELVDSLNPFIEGVVENILYISVFDHQIKERTLDAQFIIISLRDNMFELANRLVGIYKTENCTKSVVLYIDQIESTT